FFVGPLSIGHSNMPGMEVSETLTTPPLLPMIRLSLPHPKSYRPDLPLTRQVREVSYMWYDKDDNRWRRGMYAVATQSLKRWADKVVREWQAKQRNGTWYATTTYRVDHLSGITVHKAHPLSYRPDLPL